MWEIIRSEGADCQCVVISPRVYMTLVTSAPTPVLSPSATVFSALRRMGLERAIKSHPIKILNPILQLWQVRLEILLWALIALVRLDYCDLQA